MNATRRIFVGDIQGCRQELDDLLEACEFAPERDRLYSVGDAINRGPDSAGSLRRLIELDATMVIGNHELHYFSCLAGTRTPKGRDTLSSLLEAPDREELTAWLRERPILHVEEDLMMVHAGLHPKWTDYEAVAEELHAEWRAGFGASPSESLRFATSARLCDPNGRLPRGRDPQDRVGLRPWDSFYNGDRLVIFGHWAKRGLAIEGRVRGLDSGCVYGKKLSAWIAEEDRVVQVQARQVHCPLG